MLNTLVPGQRPQMGPPPVRGSHLIRPPMHLPLRGGLGQVRHGEVRLHREEPVEPLHASVQLQVKAGLQTLGCIHKTFYNNTIIVIHL